MDISPFFNFIEYLTENEIKEINIVMHSNPDPDSIGSAAGIKEILSEMRISSEIYYNGTISHPQNKTLVNVLGLSLNKANEDIEGVNICVDCTPLNSKAKDAILIIDHHKNKAESNYTIIEPTIGSCCSIVWEIMKQEKMFDLSKEDTDRIFIYTAMLLGIRTDTNDLISETISKEDFIAYQELLEYADKESLQKVMNYPFPRYLYETRIALHKDGNVKEHNGVFIGGIGFVPDDQRDAIAILSEEYARMESVQTAVIFAIVGKKNLQVSVRSSNVSLDVGTMCADLFGGGGASTKGGATIPLNFFSEITNGDKEKLWDLVRRTMFKKILKEAWVEDDNTQIKE